MIIMNRKRFEFVGRCEDETLGRSKDFWGVLLKFSLPRIPMCLGAKMNVIRV